MTAATPSCATCGWHGVPAGPFCPSCGAQLTSARALPTPLPAADAPRTGGRMALLALAGALLIVFLTLFVVGIALANRDPSIDAAPTLVPNAPSATALLTLAPQTPAATQTPRETPGSGGRGKPTATALQLSPRYRFQLLRPIHRSSQPPHRQFPVVADDTSSHMVWT